MEKKEIMMLDFTRFNAFIEKHARPRWENQDEEWPLRTGGGEVYIQEMIVEKSRPHFTQDKINNNVKDSLLYGLKVHVNLLSRFEFSHAKKFIELTSNEELENKFSSLFYDEEPLLKRLDHFLEWAKVQDVEGENKKKGINPTVCSYFLALSEPRIYPYCKPVAYNGAINCFKLESAKKTDPIERIIHCQGIYEKVLSLLEDEYGLKNGNLFDVHSLFYLYQEVNSKTSGKKQYWLYAPGRDAKYWDEFYEKGIMAIGWDFLGNLKNYSSKEQLRKKMQEHYDGDSSYKNRTLACFDFANNIRIGDIIFAKRGTTEIIGYGEVTSDYEYDESLETYKHFRSVNWVKKGTWDFSDDKFALKTLTNITRYPDFVKKLKSIIDGETYPPKSVNYWWLNANPKIWNFIDTPIGDRQVYTSHNERGNKRMKFRYFNEVRAGDFIFGYVTSPYKEITALCRVTRGLHQTQEGEGFEFEKIEQYEIPVSFEELKTVPDLKNCEPLKNNQGSLFRLQENEYEIIRAIIDEKIPVKKIIQVDEYNKDIELGSIFVTDEKFSEILDLLEHKKNIVLQGPPGVGKTFLAKHLAFAILGKKDEDKVQTIQFHQSYSYEDFIQGYRPNEDEGFYLKPGVFFNFCKKALRDSANKYFFIIDEINRGNLSKIMGELMMLIEPDKRGKVELPLTYSKSEHETFTVPPNLYLIGTMNTADRSLAMVDYALRRRFCFVDLKPQYDSEKFSEFLKKMGVSPDLIRKINSNLSKLNKQITEDVPALGPGFQIGHSYFCVINGSTTPDQSWYQRIVKFEIAPLLREYWYDSPDKADSKIEIINN